MISRLLEVAGYYKPKVDDKQIVDISLDNTYNDAKGTLIPTVLGYPNGVPVFDQNALRVNINQGITFTVAPGKPRLLNSPDWRFEFEIKMVNPAIFKHEPMIALRRAGQAPAYHFHFWKRAQTNNTVIVSGDQWKVETAPMFTDIGALPANTWRTYAIEHTAIDNTTRFFVNGVLRASRVSSNDVSCDSFEILSQGSPNFFNGWIRNIKFFKALA